MSDAKHTPAPWRVGRNGLGCACEVRGADGVTVGRMTCGPVTGGHPHESADLTLMAAAPDLLAACEAVLRDNVEGRPSVTGKMPLYHDTAKALEAAIKKARG